jgi:hypothetical protein
MNEQRKWTIVLATIAVFMTTAIFLPGLVRAGDLEPSAPPGATMKTLDEIYNKLETIDTKLEPGGDPCEPCGEAPVPKTGQTGSYAAGDDGDLEKGVAWPDPRFTDHGDGTVTDNLTGLMWTKNADMYGQRTWAEALSDCAGCTEGGYNDWRLPNVRELQSLIDYGQYDPALPDNHPFDPVQSSYYWSSSTYANATGLAWYVSLYVGGYVNYNGKGSGSYVWCVRGGQ